MKLKTRRIIMFGFILTFLIFAPILLFYASGYRFDLKRHKILKTGTLFIEGTDIKKADLYLNNKQYEEQFSEKIFIYNLLPGDYIIKLADEGYFDWQKKITINSSLTTFIKDAILFKQEVPLQLIDGEIKNFVLSPDGQKIIYTSAADPFMEFYLLDLETKDQLLLYRITAPQKEISLSWAPSSKKILAQYDGGFIVLNAQNPKNNVGLKTIIDFTPAQMYWDLQSDNILHTGYKNIIYKIDLFNKDSQEIFQAENELNPDFFIEGNDIFYIIQEESKNSLFKYNLSFKTNKKIMDLSKAADYKFIKSTNNFLELIDLDNQKLYLIKKINADLEMKIITDEPIKEFTAKDASWDDNEKLLIFYDDFEISSYSLNDVNEHFINRYGQEIKKINWYPDLNHLVILFGDSIQIIDLTQEVGTRNYIEILKFDEINDYYLDKKGEILFFNGQIGKQQGLYQLNLK